MIRRTTRILLSALLIAFASALIITAAASYFYWQQLIPWAAERWLQQHQWQITEIKGNAPTTEGWQLDSLHLQQTAPAKTPAQLQLNGLKISWNLSRLFTEGKLEAIQVQEADIYLPDSPAETGPSPSLNLKPWLSPALISQIPADDIRLNNLRIRREQNERISQMLTQFSLSNSTLEWHSQIESLPSYSGLEGLSASLKTTLTEERNSVQPALLLSPFQLDIRHRNQQLLFSEGDLALGEKIRLTAEHQLQLQSVASVLRDIPESGMTNDLLSQIRGTLNIAGTTLIQSEINPAALLQSLQPESEQSISLIIPPGPLSESGLPGISGTATLALNTTVSLTPSTLSLVFDGENRLTVSDLQSPSLHSKELRLSIQPSDGIQIRLADLNRSDVSVQIPATTLTLQGQDSILISDGEQLPVSLLPIRMTSNTFSLCITSGCPVTPLHITGLLNAEDVRISHPDMPLPAVNLSSNWQVEHQTNRTDIQQQLRLTLTDSLLPDGQQLIRGNTRIQIANNQPLTTANWQLKQMSLDGAEQLIKRYYPALPAELTFSGGSLSHQGALHYENNRLALRLRQRIEDLGGQYGQNTWGGLNWHSDFRRSLSGRLRDDGSVTVDFIAAGIPVEQFSSNYQLVPEEGKPSPLQLRLTNTRAQLLGGEVQANDFTISETFELDTQLALNNIQLADVLALEQQEGLNGEGTLQGSIPLKKTSSGFQVTDGWIKNTDNGWIKFRPTPELRSVAQTTPGLDTAFKALENLQYSQLNINVNYESDGNTRLNTRLKGLNPNWNAGQRIEFGINIEENLLQLIKALQYTNKLTRSLEKRYR